MYSKLKSILNSFFQIKLDFIRNQLKMHSENKTITYKAFQFFIKGLTSIDIKMNVIFFKIFYEKIKIFQFIDV